MKSWTGRLVRARYIAVALCAGAIVATTDDPTPRLRAQDASWVAGHAPAADALAAKTRYRQADAACRFASGGEAGFALDFTDPQWAVTPGQSAVLYDGDVCLGGGVITTDAASVDARPIGAQPALA